MVLRIAAFVRNCVSTVSTQSRKIIGTSCFHFEITEAIKFVEEEITGNSYKAKRLYIIGDKRRKFNYFHVNIVREYDFLWNAAVLLN